MTIRNLDQYKETDNRYHLADFSYEDLQLVKSAKIKVHLKLMIRVQKLPEF